MTQSLWINTVCGGGGGGGGWGGDTTQEVSVSAESLITSFHSIIQSPHDSPKASFFLPFFDHLK